MSNKLIIETQITDQTINVFFTGLMDEDSDFTKLLGIDVEIYNFDFDKIDMINSCGIREWISFIEKIPNDKKITYTKCPQIIIEQMNMVHGFIKEGASIETFYTPYFCENCDEEVKVLIKSSDVIDCKAPLVKCKKCDCELEFDAIEAQYFNFLK